MYSGFSMSHRLGMTQSEGQRPSLMQPENTFLHLSEHSLALHPTPVQPHVSISFRWLPSIVGLCSLSVNLWGPAWAPVMSSLVVFGDAFQPSETFWILNLSTELGVITKAESLFQESCSESFSPSHGPGNPLSKPLYLTLSSQCWALETNMLAAQVCGGAS